MSREQKVPERGCCPFAPDSGKTQRGNGYGDTSDKHSQQPASGLHQAPSAFLSPPQGHPKEVSSAGCANDLTYSI